MAETSSGQKGEEPVRETVEKTDSQGASNEAKSSELRCQLLLGSPHKGAAVNIPPETRDQIVATLYGQCMGDAIGLLSEFYSKDEAVELFGNIEKLEYEDKLLANDMHRSRWETGDWTDDSDQMLLIMQSLIDRNGEIDPRDFAAKMYTWMEEGFKELGDFAGMGVGNTTVSVLDHPEFFSDPHKVAELVWINGQRDIAPNGGVMRTSILGIHDWWDTDAVEKNAVDICKVTHRDPRCLASVVAVCVAISLMLQNKHFDGKNYDVQSIKDEAQRRAVKYLQEGEFPKYIDEFNKYMNAKGLRDLKLGDRRIGYTFKCMGAGFWSLKKDDFRAALQKIVLEGGDADTNGAVVGALLGCKLRHTDKLPESWTRFQHKEWLDEKIASYGIVFKGLKNEFERAVVNEPSVFEPLKFYCTTIPRYPDLWNERPRNVQGLLLVSSQVVRQSMVRLPVRSIIHSLTLGDYIYSRTSVARAGLGQWNLFPIKGSSSQSVYLDLLGSRYAEREKKNKP